MRDGNWAKKNPPSRNQAGPRVLALARMAVIGECVAVSALEQLTRRPNEPQTVQNAFESMTEQIYHKNIFRVNQIEKNLYFCIETSLIYIRDHYTDRLIKYFYYFFSGHSFWGLIDWFLTRRR